MKRIIFALHGIRTYGDWHKELEESINLYEHDIFDPNDDVDFFSYDYGYFGFLQFFSPKRKKEAVDAWVKNLNQHWNEDEPSEIDIFAHSFGTYLVLKSLLSDELPENFKVRNVVFAGSALPPEFFSESYALLKLKLTRLVNDCGINDCALIATLFVHGTGMAGRVGFHGVQNAQLFNRYFNYGHSGYFDLPFKNKKSHIVEHWLPILVPNSSIKDINCRSNNPSFLDRILRTLGEHGGRVTLAIYSTIIASVFLVITGFWLAAERQTNIAEAARNKLIQVNNSLRRSRPLRINLSTTGAKPIDIGNRWYEIANTFQDRVVLVKNETNNSIGTGFILNGVQVHPSFPDKPLLITASHVFGISENSYSHENTFIEFPFSSEHSEQHAEILKVIWQDENPYGVAIVELKTELSEFDSRIEFASESYIEELQVLEQSRNSSLETVLHSNQKTVLSFPSNSGRNPVFSIASIIGITSRTNENDQDKLQPIRTIYTPHFTEPGASGAPYFDSATGELVCIHMIGSASLPFNYLNSNNYGGCSWIGDVLNSVDKNYNRPSKM